LSELSDRPPDPTPDQGEPEHDSSVDGNTEPEFRAEQDLLPDLQGMSADGAQPSEPIAETPDITDGKVEAPAGSDAEGTDDVAPASATDVLPDMPSTLSGEPAPDAVQSAEEAALVEGRLGAEGAQAMYDHLAGASGAGTGIADNIEFTADAMPVIRKEVGEAMGQAQVEVGGTPVKDEIDAHLARIRGESELQDAGANVGKQFDEPGGGVGEAMGQAQVEVGGTPVKDEIDAHLARIRGESELHARRQ